MEKPIAVPAFKQVVFRLARVVGAVSRRQRHVSFAVRATTKTT